MFLKTNLKRRLMALVMAVTALGAVTVAGSLYPETAEARAGGGRSFGRGGSSGGMRRPSFNNSLPPSSTNNMYRAPSNPPLGGNPYQPAPQAVPEPPRSGGFWRNMAGGVAGGFLGSMLFNSIGHGMGGGYGGGGYPGTPNEGGSRGIGFLDLILLGGLAYFVFRWWRRNQTAPVQAPLGSNNVVNFRMPQEDHNAPQRLAVSLPVIDPEEASDIFFRVQGAWTRRDLAPVSGILGAEVATELEKDLAELKTKHQINCLENISIRHVEVGQGWPEGDLTLVTVRFTANLLDYTIDETSRQVVSGSDSNPVKFVEDWTFAQASGRRDWQLVGIAQV